MQGHSADTLASSGAENCHRETVVVTTSQSVGLKETGKQSAQNSAEPESSSPSTVAAVRFAPLHL